MARDHQPKPKNKDIVNGGLTISQTLDDGGTLVRIGNTVFSVIATEVRGDKTRLKFASADLNGPPPPEVEILRRTVFDSIGGFPVRKEAAA